MRPQSRAIRPGLGLRVADHNSAQRDTWPKARPCHEGALIRVAARLAGLQLQSGRRGDPRMVMTTGPKIAQPKASPKDVLAQAKDLGVKIVDFKFVDLPGLWQHFSIPVEELSEDIFSEGIGFDGSSIRGFQKIHESDMLLLPDPDTPFLDPACTVPTLSIICDVIQPGGTRERYSRDPRFVAKKAEAFLTESGIATTAYFG